MVTGTSSRFGHEASTPQKPSTRTVAQRKVYGKKKNNASRAMFDPKSPARPPQKAREPNDAVDAIQAKLAEVSLEEPAVVQDVESEVLPSPKPANQKSKITSRSKPHNPSPDPPSPAPSAQSTETNNHPNSNPVNKTNCQTLLEVRICTKMAPKPPMSGDEATTAKKAKKPKAKKPEQVAIEHPTRKRVTKPQKIFKNQPDSPLTNPDIEERYYKYVEPLLKEATSTVSSESIHQFSTFVETLSRAPLMFDITKLAEGSYGEVYKLHLREESQRPAVSIPESRLAELKKYGDHVFKIVPLRAMSGPGSKKHTTIEEIVAEVQMLKYLDAVPGFARFGGVHVVQGRFPAAFQAAWDQYKKTKDDCLNPNPAHKSAYPDTQLWAIIEMVDAGCELEKFPWSSIFQIYDIFWGVAMALARAEEYAGFEHRDLHLGNVCIRSTRPNGSLEPPTDKEIARQSSASGFGISRIETTIIDYSLSRAELCLDDQYPNTVTETASCNLDKKQIFDSIGQDEDEMLLRDTYRLYDFAQHSDLEEITDYTHSMRATVYTDNPLEKEKPANEPDIWKKSAPRTNLVWLLFILKNLLKNRKPEPMQRESTPVDAPKRKALGYCSPNKPIEKQSAGEKPSDEQTSTGSLAKSRQIKDLRIRVEQLEKKLENRLGIVLELLDLEHGDHEDFCCAADLVAYALDSEWLVMEDYVRPEEVY